MVVLAVAALSARVLAEAAADDGYGVVALDLFGDADTRRACSQWLPIGRPEVLQIDAALLLSHLATLAQRGDVTGWIAGAGFDGRPDLLERGAALLPLIGTPPDAVRRVRDPQRFFAQLDAARTPHPAVQMTPPADVAGWLVKDAHGCGGWHIRRAPPPHVDAPDHHYFQREMPGTPMSATFIADGRSARVLGFNELIVRPFGARPFVYCGVVGPVPLPEALARRIGAAVDDLAAAFSLRGLGSLDFMRDGDDFGVLEINPRLPASMALYGPGLVADHVRACLQRELPQAQAAAVGAVRGTEIVFARRPLQLDERAARRLGERAECHDLPAGAARFGAGDPVCSVSASGSHVAQVRGLLQQACDAVHHFLESLS
jgi:uncharacterized protein